MDQNWIRKSKPNDLLYDARVRQCVNFAVKNNGGREKLPCLFHKCHNLLHKRIDKILNLLTNYTFDNTYTCWIWHGEKMDKTHVGKPKNRVFEEENVVESDNSESMLCVAQDKFNDDPSKFEGLLLKSPYNQVAQSIQDRGNI
ncbi:Enhancer of translation termination 1 [Bienertia sinuspersici]